MYIVTTNCMCFAELMYYTLSIYVYTCLYIKIHATCHMLHVI